jgi:hypothetical protein
MRVSDPVLEFGAICPTCGSPKPRKCSECGVLMIGYRPQAATCSGACRVARHRRLHREEAAS